MFRKTGDWQKLGNVVSNLSRLAVESRNESLKNWALKSEGVAKGHIANQDLGWKPLTIQTKSRKIRKGYSDKILVATSTYFQSITSFVQDKRAFAGVKRGVMSSDGKEELVNIAPVHEFGSESQNIPARPLWQPTMKEVIAWHRTNNKPEKIFIAKVRKFAK